MSATTSSTPVPLTTLARPSAARTTFAIMRRELAVLFDSPIAYIVIALFLLFAGVSLFVVTDFFGENEALLRGLFGSPDLLSLGGLPLLLVYLAPAVTMRLVSEEKRSNTLELLVTWPITDLQIVGGKYLASLAFLLVMMLFTVPLVLIVGGLGDLDVGLVLSGYLALFLVGASYMALGLMASTWTRNQIIALIVGAALCGLFYGIDMIGLFWTDARSFFEALSIKSHFQNVIRGVIDLRDLAFYLGLIAVCFVVTVQSLGARNWKK